MLIKFTMAVLALWVLGYMVFSAKEAMEAFDEANIELAHLINSAMLKAVAPLKRVIPEMRNELSGISHTNETYVKARSRIFFA